MAAQLAEACRQSPAAVTFALGYLVVVGMAFVYSLSSWRKINRRIKALENMM